MKKRTKRGLVLGGAALAIVGGGGVALAETGTVFGGNERQAFLDDAAARLKVSSADLQNALEQASYDRIDAAVKAGKLTQEQADAIKARLKEHGGLPAFGLGPGGPGFGHGHGGPRSSMRADTSAAAAYLGLTSAELRTQLRSGKTLADIAKAKGKTVAGLKQAMLDATKKDLDAAVKAGKLTQTQADSMLDEASKRLDDMIQNGLPRFGDRRPGDGPRFQMHPGGAGGRGQWGPPPGPPAA